MNGLGPILMPDAPIVPSDHSTAASGTEPLDGSFDELLTTVTVEAIEPRETASSSKTPEVVAKDGEEDEASEPPVVPETAEPVLLSSSLVYWQVQPPSTVSTALPELGTELTGVVEDGTSDIMGSAAAPANGGTLLGQPTTTGGGTEAALPKTTNEVPLPNAAPQGNAFPATAQSTEATESGQPEILPAVPQTLRVPRDLQPGKNDLTPVVTPEADAAEVLRAPVDGIPVAKEHRAMPDLHLPTSAKLAPAAFAESASVSESSPQARVEAVDVMAQFAGQHFGEEPRGGAGQSFDESRSISISNTTTVTFDGAETFAPEPVVASDAAQVLQQVERAIERLRAHESQRVEVRLQLEGGGEVIVRLRLEQGQVRAVFQTGSEGLRSALESGWSQLALASQSREVTLGEAVFQSSSAQSGNQDFRHSREHRGHQHHEPQQFGNLSFPSNDVRKTTPASRPPFSRTDTKTYA